MLAVRGNSQSPEINDGDVVLVNTAQKQVIDGKYYAIRIGQEARIKKLFRQLDGKVRVESLNAATEFLTPEMDVEILGVVVQCSKKF